jgi:hypothetical protein
MIGKHICRIGSACAVAAASLAYASATVAAEDLVLARDGFFYVGGKPTVVDGHEYISGQMYVEVRIPARKTKPYPIIMVHGGTMSGTNYTGTPDGREGWAQYFVREGYAVYVVDQPGRGRSGYLSGAYGPSRNVVRSNSASRFVSQEKSKLWPQAYHAPYDHCTVKYLQQAGVKPSYIRLADVGIHGNSHVMMLEKNNKEIAGVIAAWLAKNVND